ncbi:hypothetical protein Scep_008664 [Stephania cephalantha]|uniref:Syntaxin 6/10/61 N-terminal domain-containing protein n=1 Tax=Stephania cephalantha TaxID=152367 RepID=A0AAP0KCD8_9MAGN
MMVANSFDLWQKDSFFSAAEEVQDSADIMESVYRTWIRERREEGVEGEDLVELRRELQTVLATAKWQLEEFERAVRLSHGCRPEDATATRHYQFVAAIEDQINRVQVALGESVSHQGNHPLPCLQLDDEERHDLAAFLSSQLPPKDPSFHRPSASNTSSSSSSSSSSSMATSRIGRKHVYIDLLDSSYKTDSPSPAPAPAPAPDHSNKFKDLVTLTKDSNNYVVELQPEDCPITLEDTNYQTERLNGQRRTWNTPNFATWKIVIADQDKNNNALDPSLDSTPKGKGFKTVFWKLKAGEHLHLKGLTVNKATQLVGQLPRQLQSLQHMQFSRSLRIVLFIMLTIFLIVPFMLYSN